MVETHVGKPFRQSYLSKYECMQRWGVAYNIECGGRTSVASQPLHQKIHTCKDCRTEEHLSEPQRTG